MALAWRVSADAVGRARPWRTGMIKDSRGKPVGISLNRKLIPCLTVNNQIPKIALLWGFVA
jgi:hypothetical protein